MPLKVREIVKMLERDGWVLVRTRGSHRQFKHPSRLAGLLLLESLGMILRKAR